MNFSLDKTIQMLERTPMSLRALLSGQHEDWIGANEGPKTWSAYDIIGHLIHGEKTDWIPRTKIILFNSESDKTFIPFDQFAQQKDSKGKSIEELLDEFDELRSKSLTELASFNIGTAELKKTGIHPELGDVTLAQLLSTWTIHDLSHIHQMSRAMVKHYSADVGPWSAYVRILRDSL